MQISHLQTPTPSPATVIPNYGISFRISNGAYSSEAAPLSTVSIATITEKAVRYETEGSGHRDSAEVKVEVTL